MTAISFSNARVRKINVSQDLLAVADLIEICFASTMDSDGRDYLRHLRWSARDLSSLAWLQNAAERIATPLFGFVWEEDGKIVGNLSLIPINRGAKVTYLIANVAVHPNYRRGGIGRALTQAALDHLAERGVEVAWLQVRDDNPVAYHLYLSLGFVERTRRTTWVSPVSVQETMLPANGIVIQHRHGHDWPVQQAWLREIYPPDVSWNLPISFSRLNPDPVQGFFRWLRGEPQENWAAYMNGKPVGFLTWEPMRSSMDVLWAAADPEYEEAALRVLLPHARRSLARRSRPLSVNYPAGRAAVAFQQAGFNHHQTLVWMSIPLQPPR